MTCGYGTYGERNFALCWSKTEREDDVKQSVREICSLPGRTGGKDGKTGQNPMECRETGFLRMMRRAPKALRWRASE